MKVLTKATKLSKGFTLIELLVTIVIVGILATVSVVTYGGYQERAREAKKIAERHQNCKVTAVACLASGSDNCITFEECLAGIVRLDLGNGNIQYWTDANANTGTRIDYNTVITQGGLQPGQKVCYQDSEASCDIYGGLYDFNEALNVCDDGFHLPSSTEIDLLGNYTSAGNVLAVGETAAANNELGLGLRLGGSSPVFGAGAYGKYQLSGGVGKILFLTSSSDSISSAGTSARYMSVRCLKD